MSRLKDMYKDEIVDAMIKKFGYKNIMEVPKIDKIVLNMGVGEAKDNAKALESAVKDMETITGQKVVTTKAKNSVANFKIREGQAIGCKTTLRGEKMYEFFISLSCCYEDNIHTSYFIYLIVFDFREDDLLLDTKCIVSSASSS